MDPFVHHLDQPINQATEPNKPLVRVNASPRALFFEPIGSACSDRADEAPIEPTDPASARPLVAQSFFIVAQ
jgi:hypothetical protein